MKNFFVFFSIFFIIIFSSCNNANTPLNALNSAETLQNEAEQKLLYADWNSEIEKNLLKKNTTQTDYVSRSVELNPSVMAALSSGENMASIYPELEGFGSLDISDVDDKVRGLMDDFCKAILVNSEKESFMANGRLHFLVLFLNDIKNYGLLKSWIFGKPFISEDLFQIPIRFYFSSGTLDTFFYLVQIEETWKIDQIQIYKWDKENGKN